MKMVSIKEMRDKIGDIRKNLQKKQDLLLTYNGKPIALMLPVDENDDVFSLLNLLKRYQVLSSIAKLQVESAKKGYTKVSMKEINEEIDKIRKKFVL